MKITIIETGLPPEDIRADWPDYPTMFETLIGAVDDGFTYEAVSVVTGTPFPDPADLEAILITGSAAGVYDDEPWIAPLLNFIRAAADADVPQFGICFGHQAMAEALGGKAEKSHKGWGVGRHEYTVPHKPDWMADAPDTFALAVSHQDQVTAVPAGARIIAASDFCECAGVEYIHAPAASFQGHPEFGADFASALHQLRRERIGSTHVDNAIASFNAPLDSALVAKWMARFFRA